MAQDITLADQHAGTTDSATRRDAGFSLLEIMVVVVIISILSLVIAPRIIDRPDQARAVRAQSDLEAIESALMLYRLDNFRFPTTEQGLAALVEPPKVPPLPANYAPKGYIAKLPQDPWGAPYQYLAPGIHGEVDVFTFGADGVQGGEGSNRDIGTWDLN
jgi:general secretion pathway protein G